jgi:hypothetical protein
MKVSQSKCDRCNEQTEVLYVGLFDLCHGCWQDVHKKRKWIRLKMNCVYVSENRLKWDYVLSADAKDVDGTIIVFDETNEQK